MRVLFVLGSVTLAGPLAGQEADFNWHGRIAQGDAIEIRGVIGTIRAVRASGDEVEVTAVKRWRRSDPDEVEIEVIPHDGGVTICAVYPTPWDSRRDNGCRPGGGHNNTRDNDVSVNWTIHVPAGVTFHGVTVNGDVYVEEIESDTYARTVNGDIEVSTTGVAEASTVNGGIRARMGRADWQGSIDFSTVNGSITVEVPDGFHAEVDARTVNGDFETDFPITVRGRFNRRRFSGVIGDGGRQLRLETVNGSVRILKR
ncbi:MAG TPA: DUF4097 family beta strand repeat-containing protein [Gemmatimonadales bacterium]